jgi:hypothetical protein
MTASKRVKHTSAVVTPIAMKRVGSSGVVMARQWRAKPADRRPRSLLAHLLGDAKQDGT